MIIKYKTKPNKNGNSYGLIVDTDKKTFECGWGICSSWDFKVTKGEIDQYIQYTLKIDGYHALIRF